VKSCYFLITPNCNLTCKYCFQRGDASTEYSPPQKIVADKQTIDQFAVYCKTNGIGRVELFGGEPLLYRDSFLYAVRTLIDQVPRIRLGVVTNGTLIDEELMQLFEQEKIGILLSLDGDRARQNSMRGGFDRIAPWFDRLVATGNTMVAMQVGAADGVARNVRYVWGLGFPSVYLNIVQTYDWYNGEEDLNLFEAEYEAALGAMFEGEGELACAISMHQMLERNRHKLMCGITAKGLACDWRGLLYPCHRVPELGTKFSIGDIRDGVSERKNRLYRERINRQYFVKSASARQYPLVSFCPVSVYQQHGSLNGSWNSMFCEMINIKAKIVAKHHYAIEEYRIKKRAKGKGSRPDKCIEPAF